VGFSRFEDLGFTKQACALAAPGCGCSKNNEETRLKKWGLTFVKICGFTKTTCVFARRIWAVQKNNEKHRVKKWGLTFLKTSGFAKKKSGVEK
jgi:hypothetical protein